MPSLLEGSLPPGRPVEHQAAVLPVYPICLTPGSPSPGFGDARRGHQPSVAPTGHLAICRLPGRRSTLASSPSSVCLRLPAQCQHGTTTVTCSGAARTSASSSWGPFGPCKRSTNMLRPTAGPFHAAACPSDPHRRPQRTARGGACHLLAGDPCDDPISRLIDKRTAGLPDAFRADVAALMRVLRDGDARSRPRTWKAVVEFSRNVRPLLLAWGRRHQHLREITSAEVHRALATVPAGSARQNTFVATRALFGFLRRHRRIFTDPPATFTSAGVNNRCCSPSPRTISAWPRSPPPSCTAPC